MKVLLINGSPHERGCVFTALTEVASALEKEGVETEIFHIGSKPIQGCTGCYACSKAKTCVLGGDVYNALMPKLTEADGIIVGSPVYYAGPNGALCALLDRAFFSSGGKLAGKPAAAVVSCRRGGASAAFDRLNKYFTISRMPVVSSQYWNSVHGSSPEEVVQDREGMQVMRVLGANMAWLLKNLHSGAAELPPREKAERTNFIR